MRETREIITDLKALADDDARRKYLIEENDRGVSSIIRALVEERPKDVPAILNTLDTNESRTFVMTFHDKKGASPFDLLSQQYINRLPAVLKLLPAEARLAFIRADEANSQKLDAYVELKYILACDSYLEHLQESLSKKGIFAPDDAYTNLTNEKIEAVEEAREILLKDKPKSEETMQEFHKKLLDSKDILEKRRDTWLTFFLKCISIYPFFMNTDGKALLDDTGASKSSDHKPL